MPAICVAVFEVAPDPRGRTNDGPGVATMIACPGGAVAGAMISRRAKRSPGRDRGRLGGRGSYVLGFVGTIPDGARASRGMVSKR